MKPREMLFGLVGRKLGHSRSAELFNTKFSKEGINARYELFELPEIGLFPSLIAEHSNLCGLNVTVPFKESVMRYLDSLAPDAEEVGAVNVIEFHRDGSRLTLRGNNSDLYGFREAYRTMLPKGDGLALVLGTGGASKAASAALGQLGKDVVFVSRHPSGDGIISYRDISTTLMEKVQVVVNATPLGMWPNTDDAPPIPYPLLDSSKVCIDLIYNPEVTKFIKLCAERGAKVANGERMLRLQARRAWEIWMSCLPS